MLINIRHYHCEFDCFVAMLRPRATFCETGTPFKNFCYLPFSHMFTQKGLLNRARLQIALIK